MEMGSKELWEDMQLGSEYYLEVFKKYQDKRIAKIELFFEDFMNLSLKKKIQNIIDFKVLLYNFDVCFNQGNDVGLLQGV